MLSPSFRMAVQRISMICCLSASWSGLLSTTRFPMRRSLCILIIPALLSHEMLSNSWVGRSMMFTGAERNTLPAFPEDGSGVEAFAPDG